MVFKKNNQRGVILIVVLWILVILSVFALGLGHNSRVEIALIKHSIGTLKSRYLAKAGFMYALNQLSKDSADAEMKSIDTLYQCGITLGEEGSSEELFKKKSLGEGFFEISYKQSNAEEAKAIFGFTDEERKININAITNKNYSVIKYLFQLLGIEEDVSNTIAASLVDWHDSDSKDTNSPFGAEDDYYQTLTKKYHCKNSMFDHLEEMLLLKGMTQDILKQVKPFLTVFPKDAKAIKINLNTASKIVIQSVARNFIGGQTNADLQDADDLADKIISYRNGEDGLEQTEDDRLVERNELGLNAKEQVLFLAMQKNITNESKYFSIHVRGVDETSNISTDIYAIIFRDDLSVVQWKRK